MPAEEQIIGSVRYHPRPHPSELTSNSDGECSICYESMNGPTSYHLATHEPCGMSFHEDCFLAWIIKAELGLCPNCRAVVRSGVDEVSKKTLERLQGIVSVDDGIWTSRHTSHLNSRLPATHHAIRSSPRLPRRASRRLASRATIHLQWVGIRHHDIIPPSMIPFATSLHYMEEHGFDREQQEWLEDRRRLDRAMNNDSIPQDWDDGWRVATYVTAKEEFGFLTRISPEKMAAESKSLDDLQKWAEKDISERIFEPRPTPIFSLQNYEEVYIINVKPRRRRTSPEDDLIKYLSKIWKVVQQSVKTFSFIFAEDDALALLRVFEGEIYPYQLPYNISKEWHWNEDDSLALLRVFEGQMYAKDLPDNILQDWYWQEEDPHRLFRVWEEGS
ncbi:MAG: hypothetical protein Q9227_005900 [Pyrenula ochraceoflavens]